MCIDRGRKMITALELRAQLRRCREIWQNPARHDEAEVLHALATLLAAFALGSRTATAALEEPGPDHTGWLPPPRQEALDMATDLFRSAEALRATAGKPDRLRPDGGGRPAARDRWRGKPATQ